MLIHVWSIRQMLLIVVDAWMSLLPTQVLLYKDRLNRAKKDEKLEGVELSLC